MNRKLLGISILSIFLLTGALALALQSNRQAAPPQIQLSSDPQMSYLTLDSTTPTITRKVHVSNGTQVLTLRSAHDPNVTFALINPAGKTITPANIGTQGTFTQETSSDGKLTEEININTPTAGDWAVVYTLKDQSTGRAVLESTLIGNETLASKVIVDYTQVQGRPFPISVAVFKGNAPVQGAQVDITLTNWQTREQTTVTANDNGQQNTGDAEAGDGLYSANIENLPPSFYLATAKIKVFGEDEISTSNFFAVQPSTALLSGTVTDDSLDDDGDGKIDRIVLHFPVKEVQREGRYIIDAVLRGSNGKEIDTNDAVVNLKPDTSSADIYFSAKELRKYVGVDGPYQIREVKLIWDPPSVDIRPGTHIAQNLGELGQTRPYKLTELSNIAIQSGRYLGDQGIDTNNNRQFDQIEVKFEVLSTVSMPFTWNASLIPVAGLPQGGAAPTARNQATLQPGVNTVTLTFDGLNRVAGPFTLKGLTFTPVRQWPAGYENKGYDELYNIVDPFGKAQAYTARQLENGPRLLSLDELATFILTQS